MTHSDLFFIALHFLFLLLFVVNVSPALPEFSAFS